MQQECHQQQRRCLPPFLIQDAPHCEQNHCRRQAPRMQMLVDHVERGSGHRKSEHCRDQRNSAPSRPRFFEKPVRDLFHRPENQKKRDPLHQQFGPRDRQVRPADELRHPCVKECGFELQPEEFSVVREERGIQVRLDGRQIERVVLEPRMVAHDQEPKRRKQQSSQKIEWNGVACPP